MHEVKKYKNYDVFLVGMGDDNWVEVCKRHGALSVTIKQYWVVPNAVESSWLDILLHTGVARGQIETLIEAWRACNEDA